jgi:hypothetical protein
MIFVTFNKVCTAQYFLWYFCLVPVSLEQTKMEWWKHGVPLVLGWISAYSYWLYWGYRLEFLGDSVFLQLWLAGVLFFLMNVIAAVACLRNHQYVPLFDEEEEGVLNVLSRKMSGGERSGGERSESVEEGDSVGARASARRRRKRA